MLCIVVKMVILVGQIFSKVVFVVGQRDIGIMDFFMILCFEVVKVVFVVLSKKCLLYDFGDFVVSVYGLDVILIVDVLYECEGFGLIGVGKGVVFLYVCLDNIENVMGVFIFLEKFVDFSVVDCQLVDLVFVLFVLCDVGVDYFKVLVFVFCCLCDVVVCIKLCVNFEVVMLYIILIEEDVVQVV